MDVCNMMSHVSIEVPDDNNQSSPAYGWNHLNSPDYVYVTINKAINILVESDITATHVHCRHIFSVQFKLHFVY